MTATSDDHTAPRPRPRKPADLGTAGRRLWSAVVDDYELSPDELAALREACRCVDELERLRTAVQQAPLTTLGSAGQQRGERSAAWRGRARAAADDDVDPAV